MVPVTVSSNDCDVLRLKNLISGKYSEDVQLKHLKRIEAEKSYNQFDILARFQDLLPLSTSTLVINRIITLFARKFVALLEELNVLESAELSQEALKCLKNFWSLCSNQQNVISSSELFGKWNTCLLESITPLASIFVDLSIAAHGHKENQLFWSKKLYSWLSFDLPERAVKVALLEVTGHTRDGAHIVGPLLRKVLSQHFDADSNPEYLLHFLLVKKWQGLEAVADIAETSKSLKAPASFLDWLKTYWKDASDYIPEDKSLKGTMVSEFLLDLDTDEVLEPLTDVLQMAVFPDDVAANGQVDELLFVVDKEGTGQSKKKKKKNKKSSPQEEMEEEEVYVVQVKSGNKRKAAILASKEDSDSDVVEVEAVTSAPRNKKQKSKSMDEEETSLSPRKKKQKTQPAVTDGCLGFTMDRGPARPGFVLDRRPGPAQPESNGVVEICDDSEVEEVSVGDDEEDVDDDDSDMSSVIEMYSDGDSEDASRPVNLAAEVLKRKQILISDPVTSSYFSPLNVSGFFGGDTEVIDIDSTSLEGSPRKSPSPQKTKSHPKSAESPMKTKGSSTKSKKESPIKTIESPTKSATKTTRKDKCIEEDIASKLSAIRKATPVPDIICMRSTNENASDTPRRRSMRTKGGTPASSASSMLKDWLRPASAKRDISSELNNKKNDDDDNNKEESRSTAKNNSMTKIRERYPSDSKSQTDEDGTDRPPVVKKLDLSDSGASEKSKKRELTKADVFPSPALKTYSIRVRKVSEQVAEVEERLDTPSKNVRGTPRKKVYARDETLVSTPTSTRKGGKTPKLATEMVGDKLLVSTPVSTRKGGKTPKLVTEMVGDETSVSTPTSTRKGGKTPKLATEDEEPIKRTPSRRKSTNAASTKALRGQSEKVEKKTPVVSASVPETRSQRRVQAKD